MRIIEHFFRLIAPDECLACKKEGKLICEGCAEAKLDKLPERCYRCYRVSPGNKTCELCRHYSVLKYVWIRTSYGDMARKVVHELKFSFARSAAGVIAAQMAASLPILPADIIIVHIPAATSHVRRRGFDQSALIARELSRLIDRPHVHSLVRSGQQRQVGSSRQTRLQQMKDAFRVVTPLVIKDSHVLLVDDVITTGSTLESAALELKRSGARTISAVVFAQAK